MAFPSRSAAGRFGEWTERCDAYARAERDDGARLAGALARLVADVPRDLVDDERQSARTLLDSAWARLMDVVLPAPVCHTSPIADVRVSRALAEIERRFADPTFHLRTLARQLAVSDSRLTQLLKQATGQTFGRRLHARRVEEARRLLAGSSLSVKEIASRVGYSTTSQLDRHFRQRLNRVPSQVRADVTRARGTQSSSTQSPTQQQK